MTDARVLAFALKQTRERYEQERVNAEARSKRIREAQEENPQTGEMVNVDPDEMFELGYSDGSALSARGFVATLNELMGLLEGTEA